MNIDSVVFKSFGMLLFCIGILVEAWSVGLFFRAKTTVNPLKPENSKVLVVAGLYKFTRNPMYLGMLLLLFGWTFWLGNPVGLCLPFIFIWYITKFQIKPEELALVDIFGDQYVQYKQQVRRWL